MTNGILMLILTGGRLVHGLLFCFISCTFIPVTKRTGGLCSCSHINAVPLTFSDITNLSQIYKDAHNLLFYIIYQKYGGTSGSKAAETPPPLNCLHRMLHLAPKEKPEQQDQLFGSCHKARSRPLLCFMKC